MTSDGAALYDEIPYPGLPYYVTHPDHLASLGTLYGMAPAAPSRCRVLELGCGNGGNLLPMAHQYPDSEFIGVDLSRSEIEIGLTHAAAFALRNVSLRHGDITEVTEAWGSFDYIVSHGVYSWVPPVVRATMLAVIGRSLSPQGIGYVSYNAHPGSHLRDVARDIMNFHVRGIEDPKQRIDEARRILKVVAEGSGANTLYGALLREQFERVSNTGDAALFHDDLNTGAAAFPLHSFVADAQAHGLQYLGDAVLARRDLSKSKDPVQAVLEGFPDEAFVARDQLQDFIEGHSFRTTVLCRSDIALQRRPTPDCLARFHLACSARAGDPAMDPGAAGAAVFRLETGETLATVHPLTKAALRELGRDWPGAIAFDELVARALAQVDAKTGEDNIAAMKRALFSAVLRGHVTLHVEPSMFVTTVSERPEASFIAREQARLGLAITNRRHRSIRIKDESLRRLLMLADGTRNLDRLVAGLRETAPAGKPPDRDSVLRLLRVLAEQALLVR